MMAVLWLSRDFGVVLRGGERRATSSAVLTGSSPMSLNVAANNPEPLQDQLFRSTSQAPHRECWPQRPSRKEPN